MHKTIRCYYIDEPLSEYELSQVEHHLTLRDPSGADPSVRLSQVRVPFVLPAPDTEGHYPGPLERYVEIAKRNLGRAGIKADRGRQVVWVLPREFHWGGVFQAAIYEETGFYPVAVQRWRCSGNEMVRGEVRILDGHQLARGF